VCHDATGQLLQLLDQRLQIRPSHIGKHNELRVSALVLDQLDGFGTRSWTHIYRRPPRLGDLLRITDLGAGQKYHLLSIVPRGLGVPSLPVSARTRTRGGHVSATKDPASSASSRLGARSS